MNQIFIKLTEEDVKDLNNSHVGEVTITKGETEYTLWNEEEVDTCPYCNERPVRIDDFGLTCCNACWDKHPEWHESFNEQARQEKYNLGGPMNDND